jgi:hypothetical protein
MSGEKKKAKNYRTEVTGITEELVYKYIFFLCNSADEDKLSTMILAAAFRVHSRLGPGLLESVFAARHGLLTLRCCSRALRAANDLCGVRIRRPVRAENKMIDFNVKAGKKT